MFGPKSRKSPDPEETGVADIQLGVQGGLVLVVMSDSQGNAVTGAFSPEQAQNLGENLFRLGRTVAIPVA